MSGDPQGETDTEYVKCRVLCAVLHKKHYDLGVVRSEGSVQAVFKAGTEWGAAARLILAFIKSKAPSRGEVRSELCPRWVPPNPATSIRSSALVRIGGAPERERKREQTEKRREAEAEKKLAEDRAKAADAKKQPPGKTWRLKLFHRTARSPFG